MVIYDPVLSSTVSNRLLVPLYSNGVSKVMVVHPEEAKSTEPENTRLEVLYDTQAEVPEKELFEVWER